MECTNEVRRARSDNTAGIFFSAQVRRETSVQRGAWFSRRLLGNGALFKFLTRGLGIQTDSVATALQRGLTNMAQDFFSPQPLIYSKEKQAKRGLETTTVAINLFLFFISCPSHASTFQIKAHRTTILPQRRSFVFLRFVGEKKKNLPCGNKNNWFASFHRAPSTLSGMASNRTYFL